MYSNKPAGHDFGAQQVAEANQKSANKPYDKAGSGQSKPKQAEQKPGKQESKPQVELPKVEPVKPVKPVAEGKQEVESTPGQVVVDPPPTQKNLNAAAGTGQALKPDGAAKPQEFETTLGGVMEQSTKQIDSYLLGVLIAKGYSGDNIKVISMERRARPKDSYYYQKLRIELPENSAYYKNPAGFGKDVARGFKALQAGAEISSQTDKHYVVSINGLATHEIILEFFKTAPKDPEIAVTPGKEALLVIVIDDVGESLTAAQTLADLDYPVTMAIWPRATNAAKCAEMGHARGLEIMIHQPMEPMEYPNVKPGPGAVFTSMQPAEVTRMVNSNIALVPHAVGLNNHMGSRFTQNRQGLEAVLAAMQGKNLFVLDSVTHGSTIFYEVALENGFPSQRRDIFLDVTHSKNAILHQLRKSETLAQSQGYAIAIGHPLPETLLALKEWQSTRSKNVKLVRVQDLLKYKRDLNGQAKK